MNIEKVIIWNFLNFFWDDKLFIFVFSVIYFKMIIVWLKNEGFEDENDNCYVCVMCKCMCIGSYWCSLYFIFM